MRIVYVLLSPTFGMHQYTADLANRLAQAGYDVHLVTTRQLPCDRYSPRVRIHTPVTTHTTGFSAEGLRLAGLSRVLSAICHLQPDLVHFTGVHLWNVPLVWALRRRGVPVIHTLHDLDPHYGRRFSNLIRFWNRLIITSARHILVHGQVYRQQLIAQGLPANRITHTPLLHLCFSYECEQALRHPPPALSYAEGSAISHQLPVLSYAEGSATSHQPPVLSYVEGSAISHQPFALFFGRLEPYKGLDTLLQAWTAVAKYPIPNTQYPTPNTQHPAKLVIVGPGDVNRYLPLDGLPVGRHGLPPNVEVRNRLIGDEEALDLFRRCGLLVLPYLDATQSALVAAAYFFRKPVLVTRAGALPEYVQEGRTGWVVEPGHAAPLANCLAEALSDPARLARWGAAGRAWYDEQRHLEGKTLLTMYERVVGTAKGKERGKQWTSRQPA